MANAILINDNGEKRDYQIYGTTIVTLILEDDEITFFDGTGTQLDGEFCFKDEDETGRRYLLRRMYVPPTLKRSGLGRAAVEFFKEYTGADIYVRQNDGVPLEDGSHLTENAPGFVEKLMEEGLIEQYAGMVNESSIDDGDESDSPFVPPNIDTGDLDDFFKDNFIK